MSNEEMQSKSEEFLQQKTAEFIKEYADLLDEKQAQQLCERVYESIYEVQVHTVPFLAEGLVKMYTKYDSVVKLNRDLAEHIKTLEHEFEEKLQGMQNVDRDEYIPVAEYDEQKKIIDYMNDKCHALMVENASLRDEKMSVQSWREFADSLEDELEKCRRELDEKNTLITYLEYEYDHATKN
jgi:hypothetical protein